MDAFRRQLDQLMGANRNGDVQEVSRKYYDRDVCRMFLVGLCPHELFQLTVRSIQSFLHFPPRLLFRDTFFSHNTTRQLFWSFSWLVLEFLLV